MGHRANKREQHTLAAFLGASYKYPTCGTSTPPAERINAETQFRAPYNEPLNVTPTRFRFEPYSFRCAVVPLFEATPKSTISSSMPIETAPLYATVASLPSGTLHTALAGRVSFTPYPTVEFTPHMPPTDPCEETARVFIGQLPYHVTDMQLNWLCYTFGGNQMVHSPERIMKKQPNGDRLPTGCIHAYCPAKSVPALATGMHKRLLVDDTGVWYARTQSQVAALEEYVQTMKINKHKRVAHRPYDTVVVQIAHSTYVPKANTATMVAPATFQQSARRASYNVSPPPAYAHQAAPPAYSQAVEMRPPQYF